MNLKRFLPILAGLLIITLALSGCGGAQKALDTKKDSQPNQGAGQKEEAKEIVVYSGRNETLIKPVLQQFEKETGLKVILRAGGASELANAILEEKNNPKADLFVANDAGALELLRIKGVLEANGSDRVKAIPAEFRAVDGSWVGVSGRARVIMYNANLVRKEDLPKSIFDLADPKWKGQVAMAASRNESLIASVTGLRVLKGDQETEKFLKALIKNNVKSLKGHTDVRKAVGKGEFKLGFVNHYYFHLEKKGGSPVDVIYPDQGPNDIGALVNVAGAGIVKGSKNQEGAKKLVDWLLTPAAQELFAKLNFEQPLLPGIPVNEAKSLDQFKRQNVKLELLGGELEKTMDLIEKTGLQ